MTHVLYEDFTGPFIDIDEWREAPVPHRYVHGGFASNSTRFSLYLPPAEQYQGRFFQHFTPVPDSENLAQSATGQEDRIGFSIASGAYFLETNGGGEVSVPGGGDPTYSAFRANAACAEYSRTVAREMYGEHRVYGYAYGGSGGAYRTIAAAENTDGVWDGFVPYVPGSPMAIPNVFCVRMHAMRILRDKFDGIVDALDAGGSGDALAGLNGEERAAFVEVTRMGFPPRSWFAHRTMGVHAFAVPPHAGTIVRLEWDLDGDGVFELIDEVEAMHEVQGERSGSFSEPGTHFVTVRVSAQREGQPDTSFARIDNLARARIVVA